MNPLAAIDAVPAHMPADPEQAVLLARIVAFHATADAKRCARHLDVLVAIGMIDEAYALGVREEVQEAFQAGLAALADCHIKGPSA